MAKYRKGILSAVCLVCGLVTANVINSSFISQAEEQVSGISRILTTPLTISPVTDQTLITPSPGDWPMFRRTYDGWGYSPLTQINTNNVQQIKLAWVWAMEEGRNQPTPLVHDGIMFLANPQGVIQALNARSGDQLWEYRTDFPEDFSGGDRGPRNIAIHGDRLVVALPDASLIALQTTTGKLLWKDQVADYTQGYSNSSGPLIVRGKAINGINGCSRFQPDSCFITAHDVATGEEVWRTLTIAKPGQPGGDTWGDLPMALRGGVD